MTPFRRSRFRESCAWQGQVLLMSACCLIPGEAHAETPQGSKRLGTEGLRHDPQGSLDSARKKFEAALQADPTHLQAGYDLACTLALQREDARATLYLEYVVRHDRAGQFTARMQRDPDLRTLRDRGTVAAILSRSGLSEQVHERIAKALAAAETKTKRPAEEDVLTTDLDEDGHWEAFWWIHGLDLSIPSELVAVTRRGHGLKVTPLALPPGYIEDGSLLTSSKELGLLVSAFAASHNSSEFFVLVRVHQGEVSVVWEQSTSLESTCLSDDCESAEDSNDQIDFTFMNLDEDPLAELIVERTSDCVLGAGEVTVLDLVGKKMRPMPGKKRVLATKAAELRPWVLRGDARATEQLLHITPGNARALFPVLRALRTAEPRSARFEVFMTLLRRYRQLASAVEWTRLLADPLLKRHGQALPPEAPSSCQARYTGRSFPDDSYRTRGID